MAKSKFHKLFEPGRIGTLEVKNRIIMAPMGTGYADADGGFSRRYVDYLAARAKGGAGLLVTEVTKVERKIDLPNLAPTAILDSNALAFRASELVEAIHDYGAKIAIQLTPGFGRNYDQASNERPPVSASAVPAWLNPNIRCHELDTDEIEYIIRSFGAAVKRAAIVGFDMIEIHGHAGYLMDNFMSPLWNRRTDKYGGDLNGRMKFAERIVDVTRSVVGPDFPISFRLAVDHKFPGGRSLDESKEICRYMEAIGLDALSIDAGSYETMPWIFPPIYMPPGNMTDLAAAIKQVVSIPVITVGSIHKPELAEQILEEKKADFICIGRQLLADPEWPNKSKLGSVEDIVPCIRCNEFCIGHLSRFRPVSCSVNPTVGKEQQYQIETAPKQKRVMVVGGGPAGMQAARVAALRRHYVTLYEKNRELGGQLRTTAKISFKREIADLLRYLINQLQKLGVKAKLGTNVTPQLIRNIKFDALILATGAVPVVCNIPNIQPASALNAAEVEPGTKKVTGYNIIVVGGGLVGCEIALSLALEGRQVTIIEMLPEMARDMNEISRSSLLSALEDQGITIHTEMTATQLDSIGLKARNKKGEEHQFQADTVILALGSVANNKLHEAIANERLEHYTVGDCITPRKIGDAMHEGLVAGYRV